MNECNSYQVKLRRAWCHSFFFFLPSQQEWFSVHNLSCLQLHDENIILLVWVPGFTKLLLVNSGSGATKTSRCQGNSWSPAWDETAVYRDGLQGPACHRPLRSGTSWFMLRSLPVESFCPPTLDNRQQGRGESKQRLWGRRIEIEEMPQLWQAFVFLAEKVPITETRSSEVTSSLQATGKAYILCRTLGK